MGKKINFFILSIIVIICVYSASNYQELTSTIDSGDTAWMIVASAFVLLMTPGLSFFYGGMVSKKNIISTMLQSFIALGVISILWVLVGFSLAFGDSIGGIIGNPLTYFAFNNVGLEPNSDFSSTIPFLLFALFQLKFAIITPALITGSFAGRVRFRSYIFFMVLFSLLIYSPLAHMTWHPDGLFRNWGILDFAGGTVVHMSAGFAALAGAIFLGKRKKIIESPANVPYVILGTGLLWFGWFGFNAGSALGANSDAVIAFANTNIASATAMITWIFYERMLGRKMSAVGACIGAVVGLVAITPAAGFVNIGQSMFIGFIAAIISNYAIHLKNKTNVDDTLDVFPSHGVGGIVGMLLTAVFAKQVGLIYGQTDTFLYHLLGLVLVSVYCFFGSYLLYMFVDRVLTMRVREDQEERGLDLSQHGEKLE
ncbi:ammonium transporter [Ulvibacter sp.]|jgi:Amt family ammonium transporter|nr:ammonium transporter [Flavobacteriaceae bacterium]MDA9308104.1 ammonium transporter [Flavobacteriaceae bacterium]MDB2631152.1 ammonium transporter [Ulvibacter sp.]MDC0098006.1 ammonium transporter [Flavobacteriaceae bacterium]MDC0342378.1 ammonium transporter [Flavobacteriaceae bacterium]